MTLDYNKIKRYISAARLQKFEYVCFNNKKKALKLYQTNLRLSQAFYPLLSLSEVILRNAVNIELARHFADKDWLINEQSKFMDHKSLRTYRGNGYLKSMVSKSIRDLKSQANQGKIIADLNFGFWVALFDNKHYSLLFGSPLKIFNKLPKTENRKSIHSKLKKLRDFRNRVYHNEPIIFKKDSKGKTVFNLDEARQTYKFIKELFEWLNLDFVKWTKRIDNIPLELNRSVNVMYYYPKISYYLQRISLGLVYYRKKYSG